MLTMEQVFECVRKEYEYSRGWAKGARKSSKVEGVPDSEVHSLPPLTGQPWSMMDFLVFAEKYWDEAKLAYANFTPDGGAVRIRLIKVLNLVVRALIIHGHASDIERLAGHSCNEFPILPGGLKTFDALSSADGCLLPGQGTGKLRNENPACDPLKK